MTPEPTYRSERRELLPFAPDGRRVLDVGCGPGNFGRTLLSRNPGTELSGIEPDEGSASLARSGGYLQVVTGNFPEAANELNGPFDTIWFNDVLEHMLQPEDALLAAHTLLAPGGRVVASIPNVRHLSVWLPLVMEGTWDYREIGILDRTHVRFFTRRTMIKLFESTGWSVRGVQGINRSRWGDLVQDTWKVRVLERLLGERGIEYVHTQFVIEAVETPAE